MKRFLLLLLVILGQAHAQGIPTKYMNDPAVDLTRNGKLLHPDEVHELYESTHGRFDISTLNPVETSDLWKNVFLKDLPQDKAPVNEMDEVTYHSPVLTTSGIFRFNILNSNGDKKFYTMMLSKTVHTVLLAKGLLRKLGYQVPDIKYFPKIVVKFKSVNEKNSFLSYLENVAMAGSPKNWVVEDLGTSLILQDLVMMNANHVIYNLAVGVSSEMIQGRRLLSSLAVPLSIVNLTESVNMLRWNAGVITNKKVSLYVDNLEDFQCTWDDGRWAARRIEKLTRQDWKDIVESTQIPKPVQTILIEKLISRRNSIMKLFKVDAEEIKVDGKLNNGVELVDGKLTQEKWPGYASRFAYGDPDSPLSDADMKSWIKSRGISTAMELILGQINQLPYLGTDLKALNTEKYKKFMQEAASKAALERKPMEVPVKAWVVPNVRGNLILSRNLVTGTYLGTDNLVQLVDSVGVSLSGGAYVGTMGIAKVNTLKTSGTPVNIAGGGTVTFVRSYSHLRPVTNIKKSLQYKFVNILVPLVKAQYGKQLHEAVMTSLDPNASDDERANAVEKALKPFKDNIQVGESLLVTDTLTTSAGAQAGLEIYGKILSAGLGLTAGQTVLSRFHVHRRTEDEFQIYRDLGQKVQVGVGLAVNSVIPIVTVNFKRDTGNARVKFYSLNLGKKNPDAFKNASALRQAIIHSSTKELDERDIKPYVLRHKFQEANPSMNLLFWQFIGQNSSTKFSVTNTEGEKRYFLRHYYGQTQGRNYQAYLNALISNWVNLIFDKSAGLSDSTGTNPGYSFKGQAKTRFATLDQELDQDGNVIEPFVNLSRVWTGWSITRSKAEEVLEKIRHHYKFQFFNAPVLNDTSKIYLYNIGVNVLLYKDGLDHVLSMDEKEIRRIFREHQVQDSLLINPFLDEKDEKDKTESDLAKDKERDFGTGVNKFLRLLGRYKRLEKKDRDFRGNKNLLKALSHMEKSIYLPGVVELVGGDQNLYVTAKITGFREGDEDGDRPIVSSSLGQYGSARVVGPINQIQRQMNMLEGEFFINWMMQRLL